MDTPDMQPTTNPTDETFVRVIDARLRLYGSPRHENRDDPIDELIFIVLSAQTEAYSYHETFGALARTYPGWQTILEASERELASVIRKGGLAYKKACQIKGALTKIVADFGSLSLEVLTRMSDGEAEAYLTSLPGIGAKSAKCILLYSLRRPVFPVDTHVWRVSRRLKLAPAVPKPTPTMERALEARIPPDVRYALHVNMVCHGRATCLTYWPRCGDCVLADVCPSAFQQDVVWGRWRRPRGAWAAAVAGVDGRDVGHVHTMHAGQDMLIMDAERPVKAEPRQ